MNITYTFYKNNTNKWYLTSVFDNDENIAELTLPYMVLENVIDDESGKPTIAESIANQYIIHSYAFSKNLALNKIIIPECVTELSTDWLEGSNITILEFRHVKRLPKLSGNPFYLDKNKNVIISYPKGKGNMYNYWAEVWGINSDNKYNLSFVESTVAIEAETIIPALRLAADIETTNVPFRVEIESMGIMPYVGVTNELNEDLNSPDFIFEATENKKYITISDDDKKTLIEKDGTNIRILKGNSQFEHVGTSDAPIVYNVHTIGPNAFYNSNIEYLETSVEKIEALAFQNCTELKAIILTSEEKPKIAKNAFFNCTGLEYLKWKGENYYFWYDTNNTLIWVTKTLDPADEDNNTRFASKDFYNYLFGEKDGSHYIQPYIMQNSIISQLDVSPNVTAIGHCAFQNCKQLKRIDFGNRSEEGNTIDYEDCAFDGCDALESDVILPNTTSSIGYRALAIGSDRTEVII